MAVLRCGDVDVCERIVMDEFSLMGCNRHGVDRLKIPLVKRREGDKKCKERHTTLSRVEMNSPKVSVVRYDSNFGVSLEGRGGRCCGE